MRKSILAAIVILVLGGAVWAVNFYYKNLRGVGPAIKPPPEDITKLIPQSPGTVVNDTDFPLKLPNGFSISIFADNLPGARVATRDVFGNFWVSQTREGIVSLVEVDQETRKAKRSGAVFRGLKNPHGLTFHPANDFLLYIAEEDKISRVGVYSEDAPQKIVDLPSGGGHFTRTIAFGPDNRLYASIGSSCNVCNESDNARAKVFSMNDDGSDFREFASGLRNTVFFTWSYVDGKMWGTDMGRDFLGDDLPPDEINIIEEGADYGWPTCYGRNVHDTNFDPAPEQARYGAGKNAFCDDFVPSHIDLQAHSAPLGLAFVPEEGWPEDWWYDLIVAYHGSWNRSEPTGYKLVRVKLDAEGNYEGVEDFITGWLQGNEALGRPVDIRIEPGGVMYVTDDKAGVIYKIAYQGDKSDLIKIHNIEPNQLIESPLVVRGEVRGFWFFEASFPIKLYDGNGNSIPLNPPYIMTSSEWMTTDFVAFEATLEFKMPNTETGILVLEKDNPSGLPEHAQSLSIPVRFR